MPDGTRQPGPLGVPGHTPQTPDSAVADCGMKLDAMKALADEPLRHATLPDGTAVFTRLEHNPARLLLEARQLHPHRAGTMAVSQLAAEEDGADAVRDAVAELLAHIARDALPKCPVMNHAPLLRVRTSLGWLDPAGRES